MKKREEKEENRKKNPYVRKEMEKRELEKYLC